MATLIDIQLPDTPEATRDLAEYQQLLRIYDALRILRESIAGEVFSDQAVFGDPGFESDGITINGATYESILKVSDIGAGYPTEVIIHRHSLSNLLAPNIVFARSHSNTASHTIVQDDDVLARILAVGHDGVDYAPAASLEFAVDGTPGSNDMPGAIIFRINGEGENSVTPTERFRLNHSLASLAVPLDIPLGSAGATALRFGSSVGLYGDSEGIGFSDGAVSRLHVRMGAPNTGLELGRQDGTDSVTYIDFHTSATPIYYDARILVAVGNGATNGGAKMTLSASEVVISGAANAGENLFRLSNSGTQRFTAWADGRLSSRGMHNPAGAVTGTTDEYIASGTYTPTLTNIDNCASLTAAVIQWIRVGNVVTVAGTLTLDPIATDTATRFSMSFPIASAITAVNQGGGTASCTATAGVTESFAIYASVGNDNLEFSGMARITASHTLAFSATYLVL